MNSNDLYYIWSSVAGRCAFSGCGIKLFQVNSEGHLTRIADQCHIIAKKPGGPRGDPVLSNVLKEDPDNIILLCRNHHAIIDSNPQKYTIESLRNMRDEFIFMINEKVDFDFKEEVWTGLSIYDTDFTMIDENTVKKQLFPSMVFRDFFGFITEGRPKTIEEWNEVKSKVQTWWDEVKSTDNISHSFAFFSLSYIPIVCFLGFLVRDTTPTKTYQYHRVDDTWRWSEDVKPQPNLKMDLSELSKEEDEKEIALSICITAKILKEDIYGVVPRNTSIVKLEVKEASRNWLQEEKQLKIFRKVFLGLLDKILTSRPKLELIHIFSACPTPIAFIIGSLINPSMFPAVQTYNYYVKESPSYTKAIRFNEN